MMLKNEPFLLTKTFIRFLLLGVITLVADVVAEILDDNIVNPYIIVPLVKWKNIITGVDTE